MKFGFHTQMNNWQHEIGHAQLLDQIREQVQLCEALGFDAVWLPEQQFPELLEPQLSSRFLVWSFVNLHAIMRLNTHSIVPF